MKPMTEASARKLVCPFVGQETVIESPSEEDREKFGVSGYKITRQKHCMGAACAMWEWGQKTTGWGGEFDVPLAEPIGFCSVTMPPLIRVAA